MITWGNPNMPIIRQNLARQTREDMLRESQIDLNRKLSSSLPATQVKDNRTVVHNHFNIIINVAPNTSEDKITSIVQKLTTIAERVN